MKQVLISCVCVVLALCLTTCNRDMSVDPRVEYDPEFFIQNSYVEFSNYLDSGTLILHYTGSGSLAWQVQDLPAWLKISAKSGTVATGKTFLTVSLDTTKTIPADSAGQFSVTSRLGTQIVRCKVIQVPALPPQIIIAADRFLISRVGEEFFNTNLAINKHKSRFYLPNEYCLQHPDNCAAYMQHPYYQVVYNLSAAKIPLPGGMIQFCLDTTGAVIRADEVGYNGIPDCIGNPGECQFPVSETQAIALARHAGLEEGIKPWTTSFYWYSGEVQSYVWAVTCTIEENKNPAMHEYSASGKSVIIDANSGDIIKIGEWWAES